MDMAEHMIVERLRWNILTDKKGIIVVMKGEALQAILEDINRMSLKDLEELEKQSKEMEKDYTSILSKIKKNNNDID